jgi:DNA polymerase-3 subunit alpha
MANGKFVSLHNHTELGSPLDGMNGVHDIFERAKEVGHPGLAITDHGTLTAHYDAFKASEKTGVKLLPGCEMYFANDPAERRSHHLILLPKTELGYQNILKLNYLGFKNQVSGYMGKKTPRITWEHIEKHNKDVIALTACSSGLIARTLITEQDEDLAIQYLNRFNSIFQDGFFLEIQPHDLNVTTKDGRPISQPQLNQALVRLSHDMDIPYVITCDAHYRDAEHAKYHDFMLAIKDKKALDDPDRFRYGVQDMYLKTEDEITDFFGSEISKVGMENSMKIMNACEYPNYLRAKGPQLPHYPVSDASDYQKFLKWKESKSMVGKEDKEYLRYKCIEGFKHRLKDFSMEDKALYWERVKVELDVLEAKDFSSYMLIVADYINWAKKRMPVGTARGSSAGSMVAYLTGITGIDPIKYDLIFERFHNNQKTSFPDIDTDFSRPGDVKDYLKNKYGSSRVASISNWGKLSPKVAIKDCARSLRLGGDKSTAFKIANLITQDMPDSKTIDEAIRDSSHVAAYMQEYPELYEYTSKLQNLTRNWSVHAAGVVIGNEPLYNFVPLRLDDKGNTVTQWEKTRCEDNGLIKMDLLGLKTLTVIDEALSLIFKTTGETVFVDNIPLDDDKVYDMIGEGGTSGVFQLESSLTPLCIKLKPKSISDISDINAIGRPSCKAESRAKYIRRKLGREEFKIEHPNLERALRSTFGILVYEEQAMFIAQDVAGWDLNQADSLRKLSKLKGKDPKMAMRVEANFIKDSMKHSNISHRMAVGIWRDYIEVLQGYSFNKSHSISYSHISYYTAWLRCHYPAEFMCALINSEDQNSDAVQEYIDSCGPLGIEILPPDVNNSGGQCNIVNGNIITGLSALKGVGDKAIESILENQPFASFEEFVTKNNSRTVGKIVIQSLSKAGALDHFGRTRMDMHDNYQKYRTKTNAELKKGKSIGEIEIDAYTLDEWERKEILLSERAVLGRSISGNLHEVFSDFFSSGPNVLKFSRIPLMNKGDSVRVEAIIKTKIKEFKIKNGKNVGKKFAKYLIEDVTGQTCGMTVWADDYSRYRDILKDGSPLKAVCKVNEYMDKKDLALSHLERVYGSKI